MKRVGKTFKLILFVYVVFELLVAAGPLYGWTSLVYILREEGYYGHLCSALEQSSQFDQNCTIHINKTCTQLQADGPFRPSCPEQEQKLNGVYVIVVLTLTATVPAGLITEYHGPRTCRIISAVLFLVSGICWVSLTKDSPYLIYIASISLSVGGITSMFPMVQLSAVVYDKYKATVLGFANGAKDASASVLLIFKLLYDSNASLSFQWCLTIYCWVVATLSILASFTLVPSNKEFTTFVVASRTVLKIASETQKSDSGTQLTAETLYHSESHEAPRSVHAGSQQEQASFKADKDSYVEAGDKLNKSAQNTHARVSLNLLEHVDDVIKNASTEGDKSEIKQNRPDISVTNSVKATIHAADGRADASIDNRYADVSEAQARSDSNESYLEKSAVEQKTTNTDLKSLFLSEIYIWTLWIVSFSMLRMYFFVSSFDNLITQQSSDHKVLSQYTNAFGIIQFFGIAFAPLTGPYLDGRWTRKGANQPDKKISSSSRTASKMKRYATAFAVTNTIGFLLELIAIIPVLEIQYISMLCQVALRAFVFSINYSYLAVVMPLEHYGKLVSCVLITGSTFSALQYLLLELMEGPLNADPFWIHVGLLIISFTAYGQPIHCYLWTKRKYGTLIDTESEKQAKHDDSEAQKC